MITKTISAVLLPIKSGAVSVPAEGQIVFLNAARDNQLQGLKSRMVCEQGYRPDYNALLQGGFQAVPKVEADGFSMGLCLLSKHKARALSDMARGLSLLAPGGILICAVRNDSGATAMAKAAQKLGGIGQLSKFHHKVFWMQRQSGALPEVCAEWMRGGAVRALDSLDAVSVPGVFGWDKIDQGSALLAEQFGDQVSGRVADFGAGWGYLSREVLKRCSSVKTLDVIEAEALAVDVARHNVVAPKDVDVTHHWLDVLAEPMPTSYDWVISNPPFHAGKDANTDLGLAFIQSSRKALRKGGRLLMVANRHLPYEAALSQHFRSHRVVAEDKAFKVIEAQA